MFKTKPNSQNLTFLKFRNLRYCVKEGDKRNGNNRALYQCALGGVALRGHLRPFEFWLPSDHKETGGREHKEQSRSGRGSGPVERPDHLDLQPLPGQRLLPDLCKGECQENVRRLPWTGRQRCGYQLKRQTDRYAGGSGRKRRRGQVSIKYAGFFLCLLSAAFVMALETMGG